MMVLFFLSCEPEELPVNIEGLINYTQIDLGEDYCYQKYYNIINDMVVGENLITDWDIAFANNTNSIILNSSRYMRVKAFNILTASSIEDIINNGDWLYDDPNGDIDALAFNNGGDILSKNFFLVDLGYDCETVHLGYTIINIIDYDNESYYIQTISIDDDGGWVYDSIIEIETTSNQAYQYFSFSTNTIINLVNPTWDLCFSRYTEFNVFPPGSNTNGSPLPTYRVVGVLQNNNIFVAVDTINDFSSINIDQIYNYEFSGNRNTIGYNWKYYNAQLGLYAISSPVYIIQTSSMAYYKLLFLDFYNAAGKKGAPMFQIEKL